MTPQEQWLLQKEALIAWLRAGFAVIAILVIQLNPRRVANYPTLSHLALGSFLAYSLLVLYLTRREKPNSRVIGLATTALDLGWVSWIAFATEGSRTPFFVYYMFPIITASFRYGIKGGVSVSLVGAALYGYIRFNFTWARPLGIDTFVVRSIYLVGLAYIFGFLSEFENRQNRKLLTLSTTAAEVATVEERRRIMREIHDGLLQTLATQILRLENCRKHLLQSPRELDEEICLIENDTRETMKEIRRFLSGKETLAFPPGMFLEKLKGDLGFLRDRLGVRVILETCPEEFSLPPEIEQDVYYMLREALANITRHSQASRTDLLLTRKDGSLQGTLTDDGVGFDQERIKNYPAGLGMTTMKQRVEKYGGKLSVESSPGRGTRVSFVFPLNESGVQA
jgi:signal transduction histidine kinase